MEVTGTAGAHLEPVSADNRLDLVDIVRGFALFGVLLGNLVWTTTDEVLTDTRLSQLPTAPVDRIVKPLVVFFIDHKFITLFSFLFGLGFAIQLSRAGDRARDVFATYARRLSILAIIGVLHITVLWFGDILLVYAVTGFGLLAVRRWNGGILIILALVLTLLPSAATGLYPRSTGSSAQAADSAQAEEDADKERRLAIFDGESYIAIARDDTSHFYGDMLSRGIALTLVPQVFARFVLGLYVGRRSWPRRTANLLPALRLALPWTAVVGVLGNGVLVLREYLQHSQVLRPDSYWVAVTAPIEEAGVLAMSFSYLSVLVLLFHRSVTWRARLGHLAPVGRMALTNYLTQSLLYLLLFSGVGLGLYGEVGPAICLLFAIVIFSAQTVLSRWWLARYRFGPAEWVWRTLTYGQLQPMRTVGVAMAPPK